MAKLAKKCTGSPTRKFVSSSKSREKSKKQTRPNWGCSRAKVLHPAEPECDTCSKGVVLKYECLKFKRFSHKLNIVKYSVSCLSEESNAVQEAADALQELSVESSSDVAPSNSAAGTETSGPATPRAADNWGTAEGDDRPLHGPSKHHRQRANLADR